MSRPRGSAQFEGDVDKALKQYLREVPPSQHEDAVDHAMEVLQSHLQDCQRIVDGFCGDYTLEVGGEPCSPTVVDGCWTLPNDAIQVLP